MPEQGHGISPAARCFALHVTIRIHSRLGMYELFHPLVVLNFVLGWLAVAAALLWR